MSCEIEDAIVGIHNDIIAKRDDHGRWVDLICNSFEDDEAGDILMFRISRNEMGVIIINIWRFNGEFTNYDSGNSMQYKNLIQTYYDATDRKALKGHTETLLLNIQLDDKNTMRINLVCIRAGLIIANDWQLINASAELDLMLETLPEDELLLDTTSESPFELIKMDLNDSDIIMDEILDEVLDEKSNTFKIKSRMLGYIRRDLDDMLESMLNYRKDEDNIIMHQTVICPTIVQETQKLLNSIAVSRDFHEVKWIRSQFKFKLSEILQLVFRSIIDNT
jgi:hypothetical protein